MMDMLLTDSDWETSSESSSSEQEGIEFSYGGQAQNIFSSLEASIGRIDDFLSFERGFTCGDIVFSTTDPSGQMGRVVSINMTVDLENVYGKAIMEVNSKKLQKMRSISVGDFVVHGAWLGKVDKVTDHVSVVFDDGSKTEVTAPDQENLVLISPNLLEDSPYRYYQGQRVQVRLPHISKATGWLCGNWRGNQDEGTVCSVEAGLLYIDWVASAAMVNDLSLPAPPRIQYPKNLTSLSSFSHTSWQLGDWCVLPNAFGNNISEHVIPHSCAYDLEGHRRTGGFQTKNHHPKLDEVFVIVKTKAEIDVIWQDGSCSMAVDSRKLLPVSSINTHEFWPGQFVMQKDRGSGHRWGVVWAVDAREHTVKVQWKAMTECEANGPAGDLLEETVSAYELVEHPDFAFCPNDLVFRAIQSPIWVKTVKDHPKPSIRIATDAVVHCINSVEDTNNYPEPHYLSAIGIVTGFKDGAVEVKWADGFTREVAPYEIYRVEKSEASTTNAMSDEDDVQDFKQKGIQCDEMFSLQQNKGWTNFGGTGEKSSIFSRESTSFNLSRAVIGFFTRITANLFGFQSSVSAVGHVSHDRNSEDKSESETIFEHELPDTLDLRDLHPSEVCMSGNASEVEGKDIKEPLALASSEFGNNKDRFRQFDMVSDCSDHYFQTLSMELFQTQVTRGWVKKVQQEWSILEADLPETIYARAYEERMDLLRAVLIGAPGTPYHDGLFFFDIYLPPEYPSEPPQVHYHSSGLRINPNLYESGKVCLSLLNTWSGTGSEVWNPKSSTILQVLLSLQALVLTEKPYFNEAGYDKQIGRAEGEKNSVSYNENAFLISCKSMLYLLRNPPKHFEAFVEEHFSYRGKHIILACNAYIGGARVGCTENTVENSKGSSTGFKIMLGKLLPKLVEAFSEIGVDCHRIELEVQ